MQGKMKTLIIDDDKELGLSFQKFLTDEGYIVEIAKNSKEALNLFKSKNFDIVIIDLKMTNITGMNILEQIMVINPNTKVIMISEYSNIPRAVESIKKGAFDYIPKPFKVDEFIAVLREASIQRMQAIDRIHKGNTFMHNYGYDNIVGNSKSMKKVYELIEKVANTDATVLISGESGTGKDLVARIIHNRSLRKDKQFIIVDCSTLAQSLFESELFGHLKGSFTGATSTKRGLFEIADQGTLFMDEVSNIPLEMQSKLLRVIENNEFHQIGSEKIKKVNIRLISATNKSLKLMIENGKFREDLYYRLNVFNIELPPLRERREDIPILAHHFLKEICHCRNRVVKGFSKDALDALVDYDWPGNIRELKHAIEKLVLITEEEFLTQYILDEIIDNNHNKSLEIPLTNNELKAAKKEARLKAVEDIEKKFLIEALTRNNWSVTRAASQTGLQRTNFQSLLKKYHISPKIYR